MTNSTESPKTEPRTGSSTGGAGVTTTKTDVANSKSNSNATALKANDATVETPNGPIGYESDKPLATGDSQDEILASKKTHRPWWQVGLETVALITVGIAGLEVLLGACGVGMEEILQPDPIMGVKHIPNKKVVWRMEGYSADKFSSVGMRDVERVVAKPANVFRVALLGDSATEGLQVPMQNTYASELQSIIKIPGKQVEVLNFGCSSYSTGQEVLQFENEVAQYKPDLTILLYNRGDAIENIRRPDDLKCEPRPYFYVDSKGALQQDNAVLQANAKSLQPNPIVDKLRLHSKIYGVFTHANLTLSLNEALYRKVRGWVLFPFTKREKKQHAPTVAAAPTSSSPLTSGASSTVGTSVANEAITAAPTSSSPLTSGASSTVGTSIADEAITAAPASSSPLTSGASSTVGTSIANEAATNSVKPLTTSEPTLKAPPATPESIKSRSGISALKPAGTTTVPQSGIAITEGLLRRLNDDCKNNGSKLLVVDFPNFVLDPDFGNQIAAISKLGKQAGFETFDLTERFLYHPKPTTLFLKYHFSTPGHRFVAERVAEHVDGIKRALPSL